MASILYHWNQLQASPEIYDDFKVSWPAFVGWMWYLPTYELGDPPLGLFTFIPAAGGNAWIQGAMYDWRYRGREPIFLAFARDIFERAEAHRVTSTVNVDRPAARQVMGDMGMTLEGTWRAAGPRGNDVELWALVKEDLWQPQQR